MKTYPFHNVVPVLLVLAMAFLAGKGLADLMTEMHEGKEGQAVHSGAGPGNRYPGRCHAARRNG